MTTRSRVIVLPAGAGKPVEEDLSGWPVIQHFEPPEDDFEVGLTDLTHRPKAFIQGLALDKLANLIPGQALWTGQAFVGCIKPGEAVLFDLTGPIEQAWPDSYYTDMTDAWVFLGLWGSRAVDVMQRLVAVDVERPDLKEPFYLITRSHALALQILNPKGKEPGFFLACDRSHGQNLFDSLFHAGQHLGLTVVGLKGFQKWFERLSL